jgi:hypothetical protein
MYLIASVFGYSMEKTNISLEMNEPAFTLEKVQFVCSKTKRKVKRLKRH